MNHLQDYVTLPPVQSKHITKFTIEVITVSLSYMRINLINIFVSYSIKIFLNISNIICIDNIINNDNKDLVRGIPGMCLECIESIRTF